jgi:hypothetical protein
VDPVRRQKMRRTKKRADSTQVETALSASPFDSPSVVLPSLFGDRRTRKAHSIRRR